MGSAVIVVSLELASQKVENEPMSNSEKLYNSLMEIHSALDDALGDTDVSHIEDDDELRAEHPTQWAAQKLADLIATVRLR